MRWSRTPWPSAEGRGAVVDPTPGGWTPPPGVLPGWDWTPPGGLSSRAQDQPWWVRTWLHLPVVDRYAHVWMWHHGGCSLPQGPSGPHGGDPSGDRSPLRPAGPPPSLVRRRHLER